MKKLFSLIAIVTIPLLSFAQNELKSVYAIEPTAQPVNMTFSNVKSFAYQVSFTAATPPAESYIVLRKTGNPFTTEAPVDGNSYLKGSYIGNAQVVYVGSASTFTPLFVTAGTTYYFRAFSFNGSGGDENYLTANPLQDTVITLATMMGNYYDGINSMNPGFMNLLHNKIYPHTTLNYSDYDEYLISNFESRDTVTSSQNKKVVTCAYSGYQYVYSGTFSWLPLSREHIFCQSWMPQDVVPQTSDYHNLIPTQQDNVNSLRSNHPLGNVVNITTQFLEAKLGKDAGGKTVFEPRDRQKGDDARAVFYMLICYNGAGGLEWNLPVSPEKQDEGILKLWHDEDPPDSWEIARNDYIYSIQGNRNPFIDHPEWVDLFDFSNMVYVGINDHNSNGVLAKIFPNPAKNKVFVTLSPDAEKVTAVFLNSISGAAYSNVPFEQAGNTIVVDLNNLNQVKGLYIMTIMEGNRPVHAKVALE